MKALCIIASLCAALLGLGAGAQPLVISGSRGSPAIGGGGGEELLSWDASSGATGYDVVWSDNDAPGPVYDDSEDVGNVTSASPTGFDAGDPARIRAYDASAIRGAYSSEINTPACDQTFSTGNNAAIVSAVGSAGNNTVICLNSGNYGSITFNSNSRTGYVTLRSVTGKGAQLSPQLNGNMFVRLLSLTLTSSTWDSCARNIQSIENDWVDGSPGLFINANGTCSNQNIYIYANDFRNLNLSPGGHEGVLTFEGELDDITVEHSQFGGTSNYGDGIQVGGGSNLLIGPGNTFNGINQSFCDANGGAHCDAIQFCCSSSSPSAPTRIFGNHFSNGDTFILGADDCGRVDIDSNIFDANGFFNSAGSLQISCTVATSTFNHNTLHDAYVAFDTKAGAGARWTVTNNVWTGANVIGDAYKTSNGGGCVSCTFTHNQGITNAAQSGCSGCTLNNNSVTSATYSGGSHPSTWAGWQLQSGSAGEGNGSDSKNRGTLFKNPAAPANFGES